MKHIFKGFSTVILGATLLLVLNATTAFAQDTTKPTLSITSPVKAGLLWSNAVFTVQGTAADNAGVSNVVCSLNESEVTNVVTANGWANWSAELNLIPGTNTIAAYAVDLNGNRSATNTTRLVYYLTDVLTVRTNGNLKVTIKPAYDGARLQLGVNYTITANSSGGTGFGLVNWTDGDGHILTNKPTLKFLMASNLVLTANLGDNGKPAVRVLSTSTNAAGDFNVLVLNGTATDNVGVSNVFYRMGNGFWQSAPTSNNWASWSATVNLNPGSNIFYVYAVDTNLNSSPITPVNIFNTTTPATLSGLQATVAPDGGASFQIAFGKKTFSQAASKGDTNNVNGVGSYTYTKGSDGAYANLKIKYTGPPSAANEGSQTLGLYFTDRQTAYFTTTKLVPTTVTTIVTNDLNEVSTNSYDTNVLTTINGYLYFSPAPKFAPKKIINQSLISVGSDVDSGYGTLFQKKTFATYPLLAAGTNTGKYTYTLYSPMSALIKLTNTNGTDFLIATFGGTNYGGYYSESLTATGATNGTDNGHFIFASQTPGGNAPLALTNRNLHIFANDGDFNVQFGSSTYSQDSATTNYDNAVGDYTYAWVNTSVGLLNLTATEPPPLAGNSSDARLIFVAGNAGIFTNSDGTFSAFAMTSITNLAPASIDNTTLTITEGTGGTDTLQFAADGTFTLTGVDDGTNTFTYTPFSPVGGMIRLNINSTNLTALDWVQVKFATTNSGSAYVNLFDTETNKTDSFSGTFTLH